MRRKAIRLAEKKWSEAPAHIKLMAGVYVNPIFLALEAIGIELDALEGVIKSE